MEFPEVVSDARGTFRAFAKAAECADGSWEGWLEFVPADRDTVGYATPIETCQHDRMTIVQWASELTQVHANGALSRATIQRAVTMPASRLLLTLQELVEALDRRIPQIERVGEAEITADADRLRACAMRRIALLQKIVHR